MARQPILNIVFFYHFFLKSSTFGVYCVCFFIHYMRIIPVLDYLYLYSLFFNHNYEYIRFAVYLFVG
jgi:hypothetical protein